MCNDVANIQTFFSPQFSPVGFAAPGVVLSNIQWTAKRVNIDVVDDIRFDTASTV